MSAETALPTLLDSWRQMQERTEVKKPSLPEAEKPRSHALKKPRSREEEAFLFPHNGIRFLMDELLDAVQNMDPSLNWKWENLNIWYEEYFYALVQHHREAEERVYFPCIQSKLSKAHIAAHFREYDPALIQSLDEINELIKAGRQAQPLQKSCIQTHLVQVVENMMAKMHDHLAQQEESMPHLMKKAGFTRAEQDAMMLKNIQSLTFDSNRAVLPTMVHALECSSGPEKAAAFVQNLPLPDRFLYSSSWAPDFQSRHLGLIKSVHKDEGTNPEAAFSLFACISAVHRPKRSHSKQRDRQKTHSMNCRV